MYKKQHGNSGLKITHAIGGSFVYFFLSFLDTVFNPCFLLGPIWSRKAKKKVFFFSLQRHKLQPPLKRLIA